jgi:CMP-2-keto-3-deoxyoctulosonic acid synthetase
MLQRVWEKCVEAASANRVLVATDDERIKKHCKDHDIHVLFTSNATRERNKKNHVCVRSTETWFANKRNKLTEVSLQCFTINQTVHEVKIPMT